MDESPDKAAVSSEAKQQNKYEAVAEQHHDERKQLADSLKQIITSAQELLSRLGEPVFAPARRGRLAGTTKRRGGPRRNEDMVGHARRLENADVRRDPSLGRGQEADIGRTKSAMVKEPRW